MVSSVVRDLLALGCRREKSTVSKVRPIRRLLIANRGEITCRIIRTARQMGIECIAIYSEADKRAPHVQLADIACGVGPAPADQSYLCHKRILTLAEQFNANAIHPGYGFLSENAEFASECIRRGILFVGPPANAMRLMGSKDQAKKVMQDAGVPTVPGYHGEDQSNSRLVEEANRIGYPLMVKAVRGGGGKGMRLIGSPAEFETRLQSARNEALKSFADDRVILERYLNNPRHIEVQIFCDQYGNCVHLHERDCSVQRRHQKILEEAPAHSLTTKTKMEMGNAAVKAASKVGYVGAGTVEFLVDNQERFYFMEMNTRLQVEHPVTEMITGVDLVEWQLKIASGEKLPVQRQSEITSTGHSFEARVCAEDPEKDFAPSPGRIYYLDVENLQRKPGVRLEMGVKQGDLITLHYDPLLAKLIVWDRDRVAALTKLRNALCNFRQAGIETNLPFLTTLCTNETIVKGNGVGTNFVNDLIKSGEERQWSRLGACWAAVGRHLICQSVNTVEDNDGFRVNLPPAKCLMTLERKKETFATTLQKETARNAVRVTVEKEKYSVNVIDHSLSEENGVRIVKMHLEYEERMHQAHAIFYKDEAKVLSASLPMGEMSFAFLDKSFSVDNKSNELEKSSASNVEAPLPGVIEKVCVAIGDTVTKGDTLIFLVAMKMEYSIKSPTDGIVEEIYFNAGDSVPMGAKMIELRKNTLTH